jgi:hypothetical protein
MDPDPIRRWNPGFIALRWRHVFWIMPLLGLLAGLILHFLPMIRNTATGVVQIGSAGLSFSTADVVHAVQTDDILALAGIRTDLTNRWNLKGEEGSPCTEELRRSVSAKPIPGTSLVEISVSGRSRAESELIWHALVTALQEHFEDLRSVHDQSKLDQLEAAVRWQKADVDSKREALSRAIRTETLLHYSNGSGPQTNMDFQTLKADFEASQKLLEQLQIKEISEKMQCRLTEDALTIHEAPGTPVPLTLWDTLRPLVLQSSIGLGAGMVLAVLLAYLLELLFPRKASAP